MFMFGQMSKSKVMWMCHFVPHHSKGFDQNREKLQILTPKFCFNQRMTMDLFI